MRLVRENRVRFCESENETPEGYRCDTISVLSTLVCHYHHRASKEISVPDFKALKLCAIEIILNLSQVTSYQLKFETSL